MNRLEFIFGQLHSNVTRPCVDGDGGVFSYEQLLQEVDCWRSRFDELDVVSGQTVGLRADYSIFSIAALLALFSRHAIAALIPRDRGADQYLADAHATMLLEVTADGSYNCKTLAQPQNHKLIEELRARNDGGIIIFTSGSTGRPKAALQGVERFLHKYCKPGRRFRTLAFLLFDHVAGLDTLLYTLSAGGTLVLTQRRDPLSILDLIELQEVEVLPVSPSFLRLLCAAGDNRERDLSSLKIITYGSEPMDSTTLARINERFPGIQIAQKYGTTETGSPRSISKDSASLWLRLKADGVETKVVEGVLWIRSEGTILGYLNAPSPIDAQGWYCTGDLVDVDGEWIRFLGRATDTINVGGEKVAPSEVEQSILELTFVRDAAVSGEPHPLMGQVVTACVALTALAPPSRDAILFIRQHCRQHLAPHKVPVKIDIVPDGLTNDRQKVQRNRAAD